MAQAQLSLQCSTEPSMIPISKNESPLGGRVCIFKGCFERRHTYNALRDHLFFHTAFKAQMLEQEDRYENCCENKPIFRNKHMRMLHTFKNCKTLTQTYNILYQGFGETQMNTFTMTKVGLMNHPTTLLKTKVHKITGKREKPLECTKTIVK